MALHQGARLGPYEILAKLGAGGMGEVYRARDTKLNRDVAIKVLLAAVANDPDRLARFRREAQVLASLNHPNIAHVHGLEDADGTHALVMELVEGPTLADRIARLHAPDASARQAGMPIDEALSIARQIADALEAAHEQGIVHRDLKPANIKVREDGTVKVLDFGLAKALDDRDRGGRLEPDFTQSPTITTPAMTLAGIILGTAAYMSPEQARGKIVDKRTDIWAFGGVLYEMLTGRRAFGGDEVTDTLAFVITKDPDWAALPVETPPVVRKLLRRCLEKDRRKRLADIADARLELEETLTSPVSDGETAPSTTPMAVVTKRTPFSRLLPWAVAAITAIGFVVVLTLGSPWRSTPAPHVVRLTADLGTDASLTLGPVSASAILSPDGTVLVFAAEPGAGGAQQLFVQRLDQLQASPLAGTDGAFSPFFSPDGQWIAFFTPGKLKKIAVTGGAVVTLCDAPNGRGGTWGEDGSIVFSPGSTLGVNLMRVSSISGKPEALTTLAEGEATQRWPQMLPGGKAVLYMSSTHTGGLYDDANIVVQPLPTGTRRVVQHGGYSARYLPSGHLVFVKEGTLFAAPFDLVRLEETGPPVPVLEGMASGQAGGAQYAVSGNGTLVYAPGQRTQFGAPIYWIDHDGQRTMLRAAPADWSQLQFAPDGRRLAMTIRSGSQVNDIWVYEWARDTLTRLTVDASGAETPAWTPDSTRIAFRSRRDGGTFNLFWQRADGTGGIQRLTDSKSNQLAASWHPSGKFLAFVEGQQPQSRYDVMILPMEGDEASGWKPGKPYAFQNRPGSKTVPAFSPDGRWLAYASDESGVNEVFVQPFPSGDGRWQISTEVGQNPTWSRTRHELFYSNRERQIMVVPYTVEGNSFRAETPRLWSANRYLPRFGAGTGTKPFDLHPDGERFAMGLEADTPTDGKTNKVVFVFNFFDELRRIAPATQR